MSILLNNKNFTSYKEVNNIDSINNSDIILNNNLILDGDFINNANIALRGSIIFNGGKLINRGNIYLIEKEVIEYILPFDIIDDYQNTGLIINRDIMDISLLITGPNNSSVKWVKKFNFEFGKNKPYYFSNDGGLTSKDKVEAGDELYWNESYSKLKLYKNWKIILQVL